MIPMIPIINTQNKVEFELILERKFIYSPSSKIANISLYDSSLDDASEIKLFIQDVYFKHYKANIDVTYPFLMAVLDKNHNILSAVGFRYADLEELFLEQYLDDKIENILSEKYNTQITRDKIVEIGSLASAGKGMSKFLFIALATYLRKFDYYYAVMTGTSKLRRNFRKLNLKPAIICRASQDKLIDKKDEWGSYYDTNPKVMVGNIDSGYKTLKTVLRASITSSLTKLYPYEQDF